MYKFKKLQWYGNAGIDLSSTVLKAIGLSFSISFVARVVGLFKEAVVASFFGLSAVVDVYVLALLVTTFFVGPVAGSISTPLTLRLQQLDQDGDVQPQSSVVTRTLFLCLIIMVIIVVTLDVISSSFLEFRYIGLLNGLKEYPFYRYLLVIGILSAISVIADATLSAQRRFGTQSSIKVCVPLAIVVSCLLAPENLLVEALFAGTVAGYLIEAMVASLCIRKFLTPTKIKLFSFADHGFGQLLRQWPTLAASGLVMSGCVIVDQTMAVLAGEGAVAMISFGNRLTLGLLSLASVLWTVLFPHFNDQVINRRFHQLRRSLVSLNIKLLCSAFCVLRFWHSCPNGLRR